MVVRPVGAQSPVYPLKTYSLSCSSVSSMGSPVVIVVEHLDPWVPHSIPGPLSVPPTGLVIVNTLPGGHTHRVSENIPHTSTAPTAIVPIASSAPRAAGVDRRDPVEVARRADDGRR